MEDTRPVCNWKLDANGFANIKDMVEPEGGCRLPPGLRGWKSDVTLVDENGHPADSDDPAADKCNHRDTPEWQAAHQRAKLPVRRKAVAHKEKKMEEQAPAPVALEVPKTIPTVGVPAVPSADDLSRIAANAGGGATGIVMALIAVVGGGGAVWKYLQSKQKASAKKDELAHEARMKELELQADNQKRDDDKHGECESKRAALAAKVESAESQLRLAEQALSNLRDQVSALSGKIDSSNATTDDYTGVLSKRITKLETAVKSKKKEAK